MKFLIVLSLAVSTVLAVPSGVSLWASFKKTHNKQYGDIAEEAHRIKIFAENINRIEEHNKLFAKGQVNYTMAVNQFADMTADEFLAYVNKNKMPQREPSGKLYKMSGGEVPDSVDWRAQGVVSAVKNQGQCGSCWSFSATGAMESQYAIKHGNLLDLSEQELVDCSRPYGTFGCSGGWMPYAFRYVMDHGITSESNYPYEAADHQCRSKGNPVLKLTGYTDVPPYSESELVHAIASVGPIGVVIDATLDLQFYSGGIFHDSTCRGYNHGVLAVGYGSDHWIVKNSWGSGWGEGGYFRLAREGNHCGLTDAPTFPELA